MSIQDYYRESVSQPIYGQGLHVGKWMLCRNTPKLVDDITEYVTTSVENEGMATGRDYIPNPLESEVRKQKQYRADDQKLADKKQDALEQENKELRREISRLHYALEKAVS